MILGFLPRLGKTEEVEDGCEGECKGGGGGWVRCGFGEDGEGEERGGFGEDGIWVWVGKMVIWGFKEGVGEDELQEGFFFLG